MDLHELDDKIDRLSIEKQLHLSVVHLRPHAPHPSISAIASCGILKFADTFCTSS